MKRKKIIFIGAGGHAKSVIDCLNTDLYEICGFIDSVKQGSHCGFPILGNDFNLLPNYQDYLYFICVGDNAVRKKWFTRIKESGLKTVNIIDKSAIIARDVKIGEGNFIGKMAIVNANVLIGDNNILNTKCLVEHECVIGNHCHLSTNSVVNGNVVVEDEVFYGSTAVCKGQLTIGEKSIIGAGAVIIKNVEPNVTVVGVPGRVVKRG